METKAYSSTAGDSSTPHHPIAEFLYQLTKMLTDNNNEIVEWNNGKIKVHYPDRLEAEVLHKYFRHSKFASFQRQLNYFGFRKIAGKGKMSPCSYVNDGATTDLRSLLSIKRKTNGSAARKAAMAQRAAGVGMHGQMGLGLHGGMPMSADFFTQAFMGNPAAQQSLGVYSGMMFDAQQQAALQQAAFQHQALQNASQHQKQNVESLYLPGDPYAAMARKLPTARLRRSGKKVRSCWLARALATTKCRPQLCLESSWIWLEPSFHNFDEFHVCACSFSARRSGASPLSGPCIHASHSSYERNCRSQCCGLQSEFKRIRVQHSAECACR
jgi:hypothetical protein